MDNEQSVRCRQIYRALQMGFCVRVNEPFNSVKAERFLDFEKVM